MFHFKILNKPLIKHSLNNNNNLIRCIHSKKPLKIPTKKHTKEPKIYTRDIISSIFKALKYWTWDAAKNHLANLPIKWDSYTVNSVLKTHPPLQKAWLFFNWASNLKHFKHDHFTYTTMLDIFGEAGRIESMKHVFRQMSEKGIRIDAVTYTSMMHWVSSAGDFDGAVKIWEEMTENGVSATVVSYTAFIKILFDNMKVDEAIGVYKEMIDNGISPNCHTYTVLMEYLVVAGKYQEALEIFREMQEAGVQPDKAACNILVERCCKAGETRAMNQILQYMKENHLVLRYPVFLEALKTINVAGGSDALLREVNPHIELLNSEDSLEFVTAAADDPLDRGLVLILLKKQNLVAVDRLLDGLMEKDIPLDSWVMSSIIEVNCDRCRPDGALLAFEYSMKIGIVLERTAFLALIGILMRSEQFVKVAEITEEMVRAGHSIGIYLGAQLINRLGCVRRPTCAARIFRLLPDDHKCTATYTALIGAYFSVGCPKKGIKTYKAMKRKGIRPTLGSYNVLLFGLERSGRVSDIETYRKEKKYLLADVNGLQSVSMDEKICDLLFAGKKV